MNFFLHFIAPNRYKVFFAFLFLLVLFIFWHINNVQQFNDGTVERQQRCAKEYSLNPQAIDTTCMGMRESVEEADFSFLHMWQYFLGSYILGCAIYLVVEKSKKKAKRKK